MLSIKNLHVAVDGKPILYVGPRGRQLVTFPGMMCDDRAELPVALRALAVLPRASRRRLLVVEKIDDVPVRESPHYQLILACGFENDYRGLTPSRGLSYQD